MDGTVVVPFRTLWTNTFGANAGVVVSEMDLTLANLGARAVAIGAAFEWFRFKKLSGYQFTNHASSIHDGTNKVGQIDAWQALGWVESNAALTGTATTMDQITQYEKAKFGGLYDRLSLEISAKELAGVPYKWYSTTASGAASDETSPGMFVSGASTGVSTNSPCSAILIVEGILEFRGMITPALQFDSGAPEKLPGKQETEYVDVKSTIRRRV